MALILHLETATPVCSVALSQDGNLLEIRESAEDKSHATRLTLFIQDILDNRKLLIPDLDAISLSLGPGSYTGLRIGTSVAKGLCYGAAKPLIGIPTLQALAALFLSSGQVSEGWLCPMLDARRMEVYTALYNIGLSEISPAEALVLQPGSFDRILDQHKVWFFGNGSSKAAGIIHHPNAIFAEPLPLSATGQIQLAEAAFKKGEFLDTAYFEPHYLKEFIATVPKNKILG